MIDVIASVNWISLLVLSITLLLFKALVKISYKVNWTFVILISMVMGGVIGIVFASEGNTYLVWLDLIGQIYVNLITALVAPVVLISVISGFITLNDKEKMKNIGVKSVVWLLLSAVGAIVVTMLVGVITGIGKGGGAVFADIAAVTDTTVNAYKDMGTSLNEVLLGLFPTNVIKDLSEDNVVAIIVMAVSVAVAYVSISSEEGEETLSSFKNLVEAVKKIIFRILSYIIDCTPFAVLCLMATSASRLFSDKDAVVQLLLLLVAIFGVCFFQTYIFNGLLLKFVAKVNPIEFFKKTFDAQVTAFTTQSSVGSLPITIDRLVKKVGVDEEVANFTAPLGTTIGMPGCTSVWPVLLAIFYMNATGMNWGFGDYLILGFMALILAMGSAGVPGIGVVSAVALFSAVDLPIAAVVLLMPINNMSDMARTLLNVVTANVTATVVARKTGLLDDEIFNTEEEIKEAN